MISKIVIYGGLGGKVGGRKATDGGNAQKYGDAVIGKDNPFTYSR